MATQTPYDWRLGAQYLANKYSPDWWGANAPNYSDAASLKTQLQKQLWTVAPTLTPEKYREWLQDYTWLSTPSGAMPKGFSQSTMPTEPDSGTTPGSGWQGENPYDTLMPGMDSLPDVWKDLTDQQVQRVLAYLSSALPYAELADSQKRWASEMDWKRQVDSYGTTGRAQLPQGKFVRRY